MTTRPCTHDDGTITAIVAAPPQPRGAVLALALDLPSGLAVGGVAGRYLLARCGAQSEHERAENWQIYLRRPLFACGFRSYGVDADLIDRWEFLLPDPQEPGFRWLAGLAPGSNVNLIGPLGIGFQIGADKRNLLLVGSGEFQATLLPLIDQMLDRRGRVTLLLMADAGTQQDWIARLPFAVEVRLATTTQEWSRQLEETLLWADQLCAALPAQMLDSLHKLIQRTRFRLESDFAQVLVVTDLACGVGACLACVVPVADGSFSRACIHGPVFDLSHLVR